MISNDEQITQILMFEVEQTETAIEEHQKRTNESAVELRQLRQLAIANLFLLRLTTAAERFTEIADQLYQQSKLDESSAPENPPDQTR